MTPSWTRPVLRTALAAWSIIAPVRLPVSAFVTRSRSSCASSMMTAECSGSTAWSPNASIASRAWFVTTTSAPPARIFAISAKHSSNAGHFEPRQSKALTETCDQARSDTPGTRSSRSPVSVVRTQLRIRVISSPSWEGPRSAGGREAVWSAPKSNSRPASSSGKPPSSLWRHT